jgi:iron complex outermembrane receptor protein
MKISHKYGFSSNIELSLYYIKANKGVPPETDVVNPRFWQYPDWQKFTATINGSHRFNNSNKSFISYSFSSSKFHMQINQYKDNSYTNIDEIEKDNDLYFYGRVIYTHLFSLSSLFKFTVSGLNVSHKEKFLGTNYKENIYSQNIFSAGLEYEYFHDQFSILVGGGIEGSSTPLTGDKPSKDAITDYSLNFAFIYSITPELSTQFNIGRKTRFPTLRESFSGALGRFVINPLLKSEVAYTTEVGLSYQLNNIKTDLNLFLTFLNDGIVRQSLPQRQFRRINKDEIRTIGLELYSQVNLSSNFSTRLNFTYLESLAKNKAGEFKDTLEYKPEVMMGIYLNYSFLDSFSSVWEINYVGKEYALQEGNTFFKKLPDYLLVNFRVAYNFRIYSKTNLELYFRVNNIFDKFYYSQWSLPDAGRQFWGGLIFDF